MNVRLRAQTVHRELCGIDELKDIDKWFFDYMDVDREGGGGKGYGFETYEPDEVPTLIQYEQRIRDTGNAFKNFAVEIFKAPTQYTGRIDGWMDKWMDGYINRCIDR